MRLAFVDLFFSWPPYGGADVDLYNVASGLQAAGHDVHVFVASCVASWQRGLVDPATLPFATTPLDFLSGTFKRRQIHARFRATVDQWKPDAVFLCDGFFLKPYVAEALSHYPLAARYYAYELGCPRDFRLFKNNAVCPENYLQTPDLCRRCALDALRSEIKAWRFSPWAEEYVKARAFLPAYYNRLVRSLQICKAIIVYNRIQQRHLEGVHDKIVVAPGGVNLNEFECVPPAKKGTDDRKIILMTGRAEDPLKGLQTLREAGERLARDRSDFEIQVTHTDLSIRGEHFKAIGWHTHADIMKRYRNADICVVPSIWEEPFGMVAVEAMAAGRPVCASRVGGLEDIVAHGETGFSFDPGDSTALAGFLAQLLDDGDLRARMGASARQRAKEEYDWKRIVAKHYLPLLERLIS